MTATFTATTAGKVTTRTCTTADGKTLAVTMGTYRGAATGAADLAGAMTLRFARDRHDRWRRLRERGAEDRRGRDDEHGGGAACHGRPRQPRGPRCGSRVRSAAPSCLEPVRRLTATGGFTDGKIGGTAGGAAVELARQCEDGDEGGEFCTRRGHGRVRLVDQRRGSDLLGAGDLATQSRPHARRPARDPLQPRQRDEHAREDRRRRDQGPSAQRRQQEERPPPEVRPLRASQPRRAPARAPFLVSRPPG